MSDIIWMPAAENHDFPAARDYLSLVANPELVETIVADLRLQAPRPFKAKDILRAAGLTLLPINNPHVLHNISKVHRGRPLSPVLLVRGDLLLGFPLQIADGYHRVCASYHLNEDELIPCYIVSVRR